MIMKTAKTKSEGLQPVDCQCKINLKTGEIGMKLSVKDKGKEVKHYTAKGKRKHAEYFLASLVKTFADLMGLEDIDLVKYQYEENNMINIGAKEIKDLKDGKNETDAMLAIQDVIRSEAAKGIQHD